MCIKIFLFFCALLSILVDSTIIDQRQSGDLNVQVDLKGLHIIALMKGGKEEYVDYDYAYDYSEMTIKPQNRTTPKPLIVTSDKPSTVEINATTMFVETTTVLTQTSYTPTDIIEPALQQLVKNDTAAMNSSVTYNVTELPELAQNTTPMTTSTPTLNSTSATTCRKGFVLNSKGDCEIKLQGAGNALLKLVKLSQKLKLRRENNSGNSESD